VDAENVNLSGRLLGQFLPHRVVLKMLFKLITLIFFILINDFFHSNRCFFFFLKDSSFLYFPSHFAIYIFIGNSGKKMS
jgi:hypothetical protein